ncbi:hypothetical protein [Vulgatibacter sp.]|uniref:hypothetical protein n=1 Tax=Vulgatibacter sp. TaxID=1971226 RepID=UPI00356B2DB4
MSEIPYLRNDRQVDDPFTPDDANAIPRFSEAFVPNFLAGHTEEGEHLLPAPAASAYVEWNGSSYTTQWAEGCSVSRVGVGLLKVTLTAPMLDDALSWMAVGHPDGVEPFGAEELYSPGDKTQSTTYVQIYDSSLAAADASCLIQVWGVRL